MPDPIGPSVGAADAPPPQTATAGALAGFRVVDLSRVLAGPLCTQILGDHGATVLKVESPDGDDTRRLGPPMPDGSAPYFHGLNRNKAFRVLDLGSETGRRALLELLADADVLVENFLPGTMARWGLDYERDLAPRFPRLVYCSISGFGAAGPLGGLPGYDAVVQALGGIMSVNGEPATGPLRTGVPVVDISTGLHAAIGILLALVERAHSGLGQRVEATLFDSALSLLHPHASEWLLQRRDGRLTGSSHPSIAPYERFSAGDKPVFIGVLNDRQFARLCANLGDPSLASDPRFATNQARLGNREALHARLEQLLAEREATPLCVDLMRAGVPAAPILSVGEALSQPQVAARGMLLSEGDYRGVASPVKLGRTPASLRSVPQRMAAAAPSTKTDDGGRA